MSYYPGAVSSELTEDIAAAELVVVVKTGELPLQRFVGKRLVQSTPAEALADPEGFLRAAAADALPLQASDAADASVSARPRLVAITACPTGVAHTFMAAEALQQAAEPLQSDLISDQAREHFQALQGERDGLRAAGLTKVALPDALERYQKALLSLIAFLLSTAVLWP